MTPSPVSSTVDPSRMRERIRLPLAIPVQPYLKDHHFDGKIIFPAVEILQLLAGSALSYRSDVHVRRMRFASFDRLLPVEEDSGVIEACNELEVYECGRISSKFITEGMIRGTTIRRTKVHAVVDFAETGERISGLPMDMASALEGISCGVSSGKLYSDLVPFGPSYQNITGKIFLSASGAVAHVQAAEHPAPSEPLGSTFPLDAALHAACAWGQRFHNTVAFPVGFEERLVVNPTVPGETYFCRILPAPVTGSSLTFDIWIHDLSAGLREYIRGVLMRDISGGRIRPPEWVRSEGTDPLAVIRGECRALSVIDHDTVVDFAINALSSDERERSERMGAKRLRNYLGARLALKYLSRKLSGGDRATPAADIHTVMADGIRPCCPVLGNTGPMNCSVSHDRRFAVAVAGDGEIGVDVEMIADRILKVRHAYMGREEMTLTDASPLGVTQASVRVWSIKEGVSKATGRSLAESWKHVSVSEIGINESRLSVEGIRYAAFHDTVDDHVFTLVKRE
ncbi:MAG: polyketide synthase dehydratase domain-containing protein [Deltaproteobacteria bacterium]|nr:polyketide synthase dehydratase domain-containing protein [Deltaproteobacteria bacterium]